MRRLLRHSISFVLALACVTVSGRVAAQSLSTSVLIKGRAAHPTRLLAKVKTVAQASAHASILAAQGLRAVRGFDLVPGLVVLEAEPQARAMAAAGALDAELQAARLLERIEVLRGSGLFEYVEPDYVIRPDVTPNDQAFSMGTLWGLRNTGQNGGVAGVDIDAVRAWDITTGSESVIVAVLDSGIHATHLDLAAQMWRNPGETPENNRDDDNNGYIDDVHGIDALAHSGNTRDYDGHGSHVAGTIGAAANNGQQHVGVAWQVRMMACKIFSETADGFISAAIEAMGYAADHGARILNCSWGIEFPSQALADAVATLEPRGVLVVASAGNDGSNNDVEPHYPSNFENVVSVAAIDRRGQRAGFSNYGVNSVHLGAPGVDILSTSSTFDNNYESLQGTSMAAPHVVGVATLVRARFPGISVQDLRERLIQTATPTASLATLTVSGGRVNAYQALTATGDGALELRVTPASGSTLFHGRAVPLIVRVTDLVGVTDATVTATISGGGVLTLRDDGAAPDATANDARYTALLTVPSAGTQLELVVNATAPGKTATQANFLYSLQAPPANDHFANRVTLPFNDGSTTANNTGATREPGEPVIAGQPGGASVWWTWTAPANTSVTISTEGSPFDTLLGVYTGSAVNALTEIASNDDINGPNQPSKVTFNATGGTVYQIVVDGWEGKTGSITLNLAAALPPPNDRFADRITIIGSSFTTNGTTLNGTREAGEPVPPNSLGEHSVWWTWTAPSSGTAVFSTSEYAYAGVAVYTGATVSSLTRVPGLVGEDSGYPRFRHTFAAVAGTTYQIAVTNVAEHERGPFTLSLDLSPGPPNDWFADRLTITGTEASVNGTNLNATREVGEPALGSSTTGGTIWWTWTAPFTGKVVVTASGSWTVVAAFTGSSVANLIRVAPDMDVTPSSQIKFSATGGVTYAFAADAGSSGPIGLSLALTPSPVNDNFADRIVLTGSMFETSGTNVGAAREAGEPIHHPHGATSSVWWSWTAPSTGTAVINATGNNPVVVVYTGNSLSTLSVVPNAVLGQPGLRNVQIAVEAGVTYQIAVDGWLGSESAVTLSLTVHEAPANDFFAGRATLSGSAVTAEGTNAFATGEPGESAHGGYYLVASVWWTWTAPADGRARLAVEAEFYAPVVAVYSGTAVSALTHLAGTTQFYGPNEVWFDAVAGATYQVAVNSGQSAVGAFTLNLDLLTPPANDRFANRAVITGTSVQLAATNFGAGGEPGEPANYYGAGQSSVWWSWTAPANGTAIISTAGSTFANILGVYTGDTVGGLTYVVSNLGSITESRVVFPAVAGVTYQIVVDGNQRAMGDIALSLSLVDPPGNDHFASATVLTGTAATVTGTTVGATIEVGEQGDYTAPTVWWRWTAPANGAVVVTTRDSAIPTELAAYTGSVPGGLNRLANDNTRDGAPESPRLGFHVAAGQTYSFQVRGLAGAAGAITLRLTFVPPPTNDNFAARTTISGATATALGTTFGATAEAGEPIIGGNSVPDGSAWWTWTAPASGTATIVVRDAERPFRLGVYTGSTVGALTPVANAYTWSSDNRSAFHAIAGVSYQIAVITNYQAAGGAFALDVLLVDGPANDQFADRASLTGAHATASGAFGDATPEVGEPGFTSSGYTSTLWWTWTAPATGRTIIRSADARSARVLVYTGNNLAALQTVGSNSIVENLASIDAVAGTTYQIVVGTIFDPEQTAASIHLDQPVVPANDAFAARTVLTGDEVSITANNLGAGAEAAEPQYGYGYTASSVWWTWTAPHNGPAAVDARASDFNALVAVFTGGNVDALTPVTYTHFTEAWQRRVRFDAVAGTTYQILIGGFHGAMGEILATVGVHEPPPNDNFADRIPLSGADIAVTGTNRWASSETGETYVYSEQADATVWWTWTVPHSGVAVIDTAGSNYETIFELMKGSSLAALTDVPYQYHGFAAGQPAIAFVAVQAGEVYQIAVDGRYMAEGDIALGIKVYAPPTNDNFAQRAPLTGAFAFATGTNRGALREDFEPWLGVNGGAATVWWTWTAPVTATFRVNTSGSDFDTALGVFTGTNANQLTTIATNDNAGAGIETSQVQFNAVAGTSYQIVVTGVDGGIGSIQLGFEQLSPVDPVIQMAGGVVTAGGGLTLAANVNGGPYTYQWLFNGVAIPGAVGREYSLASAQAFNAGSYSVRVSNAYGTTTSAVAAVTVADPAPSNARLTNLSTRALALSGDDVLIPGFVVAGPGSKQLLIRAVGPTLGTLGVAGTLPDPRLTLKRWNGVSYDDVATNDDWGTNPNAAEIIAKSAELFAFSLNTGSADAALLLDLEPGQYSAIAGDAGTGAGIAIVELYDADLDGGTARLINISNRGYVGTGDSIMIPGYVVSSEGPKTLLIRAVGPTLSTFGVSGVLSNPTLSIYRRVQGTEELILINDDWSIGPGVQRTRDVAAQVQAFALPDGSKDAAFVVTLNPGVYTVHARGANDATGVALVEVYAVP